MRAGRRRKLFRQETSWRETAYAGVSVMSMPSAETFADEKQICWKVRPRTSAWYYLCVEATRRNLILPDLPDDKNLLIESDDKKKIC
jgi:hypothetical protein